MGPEDIRRVQESMPDIDVVRSFGVVEDEEAESPKTTVYIKGDNGGIRFNIDAVRADDMAEWFEQLAEDLAVES